MAAFCEGSDGPLGSMKVSEPPFSCSSHSILLSCCPES